MKVKVSKEVAEVLEKLSKLWEKAFVVNCVYQFFKEINKKDMDIEQFFAKNNLTISDVENAFKYGWEVEYKFQVGDVVLLNNEVNKDMLLIVVNNSQKGWSRTVTVEEVNNNKNAYTIVYKSENREDLKNAK